MKTNFFDRMQSVYNATQITSNDYSLKTYFDEKADKKTKTASMVVTGLSTKFVQSQKFAQQGGAAFGTTFHMADGKTVITFSSAAHRLYEFFAKLVGQEPDSHFGQINFVGHAEIEISVVALDGGKSTYNFDFISGDIQGFDNSFNQDIQALGAGAYTPSLPASEEDTPNE